MVGYQYYDQEDFVNAIPWFLKSLELNPDYMVVLYRCGYAYSQTGKTQEAEDLLRKFVRLWRDLEDEETKQREKKTYADTCFQLGKIHSERGDWERAAKAFQEAVEHASERDDKLADKLYNLGKALVKLQRYDEALVELLKANQAAPRKHYIQTYLAIAYHRLGKLAEADKMFQSIPTRKKDELAYIWQHEAELYLEQGRVTEVIKILGAATHRPNEKSLHSWYDIFILLAEAHTRNSDLIGAYQAYQKANFWHAKSRGKDSPLVSQRIKEITGEAQQQGIDLDGAKPDASYEAADSKVAYIKKFFTDKGYGFIQQPEGEDVFVHIRNIVNSTQIREGARVEYEITQGRKGLEATNVRILD